MALQDGLLRLIMSDFNEEKFLVWGVEKKKLLGVDGGYIGGSVTVFNITQLCFRKWLKTAWLQPQNLGG